MPICTSFASRLVLKFDLDVSFYPRIRPSFPYLSAFLTEQNALCLPTIIHLIHQQKGKALAASNVAAYPEQTSGDAPGLTVTLSLLFIPQFIYTLCSSPSQCFDPNANREHSWKTGTSKLVIKKVLGIHRMRLHVSIAIPMIKIPSIAHFRERCYPV